MSVSQLSVRRPVLMTVMALVILLLGFLDSVLSAFVNTRTSTIL